MKQDKYKLLANGIKSTLILVSKLNSNQPYVLTYSNQIYSNNNIFLFIFKSIKDKTSMQNIASTTRSKNSSSFSSYNIDEIIKRFNSPSVLVWAMVDYANREKAKKLNFRFEPSIKRWYKNMKEDEFEKEKSKYDFEYKVEKETK